MRFRAFILSYIIFIGILFSALGTMSAFLIHHQMDLLQEKGSREFQGLTLTLARDMAVLYERSPDFESALNSLIGGYNRYYHQHHVQLSVSKDPTASPGTFEITYLERDKGHYLLVVGALSQPFSDFLLHYEINISDTMAALDTIQLQLLLIAISFSVLAIFILYFLFAQIFKPLYIVAKSSRKIANGQYGERIPLQGKNELTAVARDFNQMAATIDNQFQALEREPEAKQQFVDNFAHEIRTPLTAIMGYAEYIQKAPLDEETRLGLMGYIISEAGHMQKLGDLLLELATLRSYSRQKVQIPLAKLFEEVAQTLQKPLQDKEIQLLCQPLAPSLEGEESLIKALLINLVKNAIKACEPQVGIIKLQAEPVGEGVCLTVQDNGCGISPSDLLKVTDPFFRVDKARTRKDGGAGLGLALCKQIVDIHQGELTISSEQGKGTVVEVIL